MSGTPPPTLSILTPAYNEAVNLPQLYARLRATLDGAGTPWDWLVVDDHSGDGTFEVLAGLAAADPRIRGLRLARNAGSHLAIRCGVHYTRGDAVAMIAADLEDPPEMLPEMLDLWRRGSPIVWAVRGKRPGVSPLGLGFARLYYVVLRWTIGAERVPIGGSDCFLIDRAVARALDQRRERHANVFALIGWLGFRHSHVVYDKGQRVHGVSGWTLSRKIGLLINTVTGVSSVFAALAVRTAVGAAAAGLVLLLPAISAPLRPVLLLLAGTLVLIAVCALAAYVWRKLEESRGGPLWVVEHEIGFSGASAELERCRGGVDT